MLSRVGREARYSARGTRRIDGEAGSLVIETARSLPATT